MQYTNKMYMESFKEKTFALADLRGSPTAHQLNFPG